MLWLQGMTVHASKPNLVQLIRHQRQFTLSSNLSAVASVAVMLAQLFQLVVQASHSVFSKLVSVSDCPGVVTIRAHRSENSLGTQLPYDLKMPGIQVTPALLF